MVKTDPVKPCNDLLLLSQVTHLGPSGAPLTSLLIFDTKTPKWFTGAFFIALPSLSCAGHIIFSMTQYRKESCIFNVFVLRFTLSADLLKVKHWGKRDLTGVNSLGIQFSVERKRDFFFFLKEWVFDVPSLLERAQGCGVAPGSGCAPPPKHSV